MPYAEYAMITKELNTWLAGSKKYNGKTIPWAAGNDIYTVKIRKYGYYRIIDKRPIDSDVEEWLDENER